MGLGKLKNIFHRKSIDERIEEAFSSQPRESFSKKVWEANIQAQQKLRSEVPEMAKAVLKRPEERYNPYFPGIYDAPHGNPHEEGPLSKDFDKPSTTQRKSEFGRFDEDAMNHSAEWDETSEKQLMEAAKMPTLNADVNRLPSFPIDEKSTRMSMAGEDRPALAERENIREIMDELREIREQNAVILERLRALERKLDRM